MKHTPGPWKAPISFNDAVKGFIVYGSSDQWSGRVVALVPEEGMQHVPNNVPDADEALANAHLIAASPDLLEACNFALSLLESQANKNIGMNDTYWRDASQLRINTLKQAIAKAEGKEG